MGKTARVTNLHSFVQLPVMSHLEFARRSQGVPPHSFEGVVDASEKSLIPEEHKWPSRQKALASA
jgi:hypothetical protein